MDKAQRNTEIYKSNGKTNPPKCGGGFDKTSKSRVNAGLFTNQYDTDTFISPLIQRKAGRYGGTYIHENILLDYLMWLDMDFKIQVHLFLKQLYKQITVVKISRVETKAKFRPLTDAIRDIFIPSQTNTQYIEYAYPMIMDLINIKILGMKAWDFRALHDIPKSKDIYTRDYLSQRELDNIVRFQQHIHTLLVAGITDFGTLETMVSNMPLQ